MILSIERTLLTLLGIVLIAITVSSLSDEIRSIEEKRDENCLNAALSSIDLAVTKAVGGGEAESYVFLPVKVSYQCSGRSVKLTAGNRSVSLSYPFTMFCRGEAYLSGKFHASWRRNAEGEATLILSWSGVRG